MIKIETLKKYELFVQYNNGFWREIFKGDICDIVFSNNTIEALILDIHKDEIEVIDTITSIRYNIELSLIKDIKIIE